MNFCQINVSEYFVIANDAQHIKTKKKGEKNRTKLDPGARDSIKYSLGSVYSGIFTLRVCACMRLFMYGLYVYRYS